MKIYKIIDNKTIMGVWYELFTARLYWKSHRDKSSNFKGIIYENNKIIGMFNEDKSYVQLKLF